MEINYKLTQKEKFLDVHPIYVNSKTITLASHI